MDEGDANLLRERSEGAAEVRPVELFFDLVYVLAMSQLTHHLLDHLSPRGAAETLLLLLAVWGAWIHISWITNYFDRGTRPVRLMLIGVMLASLIMATSLPTALTDRGLAFALPLVAVLVGPTLFALAAVGRRHPLNRVLARALVWWSAIGLFWVVGGLAGGDRRVLLWLGAVALLYGAIGFGFPLPGLGRSHTTDYPIDGGHMAGRCRLFLILALGESILVTGASFGAVPPSRGSITAFGVAFVGSVTLWWLHFDRAEEAGRRIIVEADDPARIALSAYTFDHIPMVAGIVALAAADEMTIAHPADPATAATAALILGGPALYLAGNVLFKRSLWGHVPRSRFVALCGLAALVPFALVASTLALLCAATLVLVALALSDARRGGAKFAAAPVPASRTLVAR